MRELPTPPSSYAIFFPSGLQSGSWSWSLAVKVSWVLLEPFADMTQTCSLTGLPSTSVSSAWMKTIFVPSGE